WVVRAWGGGGTGEAALQRCAVRSISPFLCRRRLPMSAALNAVLFRWDDTRFAASHTLKSYLRSIPMRKQWNSELTRSSLADVGSGALTTGRGSPLVAHRGRPNAQSHLAQHSQVALGTERPDVHRSRHRPRLLPAVYFRPLLH